MKLIPFFYKGKSRYFIKDLPFKLKDQFKYCIDGARWSPADDDNITQSIKESFNFVLPVTATSPLNVAGLELFTLKGPFRSVVPFTVKLIIASVASPSFKLVSTIVSVLPSITKVPER